MASPHYPNAPWQRAPIFFPTLLVLLLTCHRSEPAAASNSGLVDLASKDPVAGRAELTPPRDPYEPNDSFQQAAYLENTGASRYGYLWPQGDEDWFWFSVPEAGAYKIEAWLDSIPPGLEYQLALYRPDGGLLETAPGSVNSGAFISLSTGLSGDYRVQVRSTTGGHAWDPFRIRARVTPIFSADLELRVRLRTPAGPASIHIYEHQVQNLGPDLTRGINLIGTLPPGMVFGGVIDSGSWDCGHLNGQMSCRYPGVLAPGERLPAVILRLYPFHYWGADVGYSARVYSTVFDPYEVNNQVRYGITR